MQEFDEILLRFGLTKLKTGLDLQLNKFGDIAVTRDGDLQLGNATANGMFRFIERWRQRESTIRELFVPMVKAAQTFEELSTARQRGEPPTLSKDAAAYHEVTDAIIEAQLVFSTLAGSIAVILNSLLYRLKLDVNASDAQWRQAGKLFATFSIGEVFSAAAANFRHYDEWAASKSLTAQQLSSMKVLSGLLNIPIQTVHGVASIRNNVCGEILMLVSQGSIDTLNEVTVGFAKALAKYE